MLRAALPLLLFAPAALAQTPQVHSLTTTYTSNNGLDGNMFDVKALAPITIVALDGHFNSGSVTIEVYTVPGTYVGHEFDPSAWTLRGSATTTSNGVGVPTPIPLALDVQLQAGEIVGFYVTCTGTPGVKYTNGTGVVYANADLELYEGRGMDYPFTGGYVPRAWNGTVYYTTEVGERFCFGDGSAGFCPCANPGGQEQGCANASGLGARLEGTGSVSVSADDLGFTASGLVPGQPAILFAGTQMVNAGQGQLLGDGLRCAGTSVVRLGIAVPDAGGVAVWSGGLCGQGGVNAGETRYFQVWYGDGPGSPCGAGHNLTPGVKVIFGG
ncbi:MAG: hypothetical protein H6828_07630 [Planctomycetes bacterium]|nr:hypothetical protein [Planctomycetota bacterium]